MLVRYSATAHSTEHSSVLWVVAEITAHLGTSICRHKEKLMSRICAIVLGFCILFIVNSATPVRPGIPTRGEVVYTEPSAVVFVLPEGTAILRYAPQASPEEPATIKVPAGVVGRQFDNVCEAYAYGLRIKTLELATSVVGSKQLFSELLPGDCNP